MSSIEIKNEYLAQVMKKQASVEGQLRGKSRQSAPVPLRALADCSFIEEQEAYGFEGEAGACVDVRITGWWRWKNVIVPPNAYVVHTRRGRPEPLHIGLGTSFRYNPVTDSYLVVPAAVQTNFINANCICKEKQGILVQGYVQWVIDDFDTAYRRLDFGDRSDPMGVVNLQLREQAEAVIKDTVATMSLDDVLADRQPIVRELTERLRRVMEGERGDDGLGLRIVTVQIKEAVVSSSTVWETLQRPFRALRKRDARLAEIEQERLIRESEIESQKNADISRIETEELIRKKKESIEASRFDEEQSELVRRRKLQAQQLVESFEQDKIRIDREAELDLFRTERENKITKLRFEAANSQERVEIETCAARRRVENELSDARLQQMFIETLPQVVSKLPKPDQLRTVSIGGEGVTALVPALLELVSSLKTPPSNR